MHLSDFQYELPETSIAQTPVEPRDSSWLLDTTTMRDHRFSDLPELLEPGDLVVVNNTRVRHARLLGHKRETGGRVEVLVLGANSDGTWEALIRPARRIATGVALVFGGLSATVASDPADGLIRLRFDDDAADVEAAFEQLGDVPLPPYITEPLKTPERYQTIYAERIGSAAAPTAGLHFTDDVVRGLTERSIEMTSVELEVGLGTFRPIAVDDVTQHTMHSERFRVSEEAAESVDAVRRRGGRVVAGAMNPENSLRIALLARDQVGRVLRMIEQTQAIVVFRKLLPDGNFCQGFQSRQQHVLADEMIFSFHGFQDRPFLTWFVFPPNGEPRIR